MSGDDDRTIVDLNIHEAMANDADADADAEARRTPPVPSGISDEDLLADLNFALDDDEPPVEASEAEVEEAPPVKKGRTSSSSKRSKSSVPSGDAESEAPNPAVMQALSAVPLEVIAVLGKKRVSVKEIAKLRAGSVVSFEGGEDRLVDLVCQGKTLGKGELVLVDGKLGVKIVKYF